MTAPKITVYTADWCVYCHSAKRLLDRKGVPYRIVDVTGDGEARAALMQKSGGRRTVPQIWIGERHVGGFVELVALDQSGELDRLLGRAS